MNQLPASALTQFGRNLKNAVRNASDATASGIAYPYSGFYETVAGAIRQYPQVYGTGTIGNFGAPPSAPWWSVSATTGGPPRSP